VSRQAAVSPARVDLLQAFYSAHFYHLIRQLLSTRGISTAAPQVGDRLARGSAAAVCTRGGQREEPTCP
jgi:hypothetical protein